MSHASKKVVSAKRNRYAITRVEMKPGVWCWTVLFRRRGKAYTKGFYDLRRGGAEKALAAAIAWRDEQLRKAGVLTNREFRQLVRTSNRSGAPGVQFIRPKIQPQGAWQARLKLPDGRQVCKTFAVKKHGERGAFKLAVAARAELLRLLEDRPYVFHPTAKRMAKNISTDTADHPKP